MAKVAANMERAAAERRQFVYQQTVRSRFIRTNGKVARPIGIADHAWSIWEIVGLLG